MKSIADTVVVIVAVVVAVVVVRVIVIVVVLDVVVPPDYRVRASQDLLSRAPRRVGTKRVQAA